MPYDPEMDKMLKKWKCEETGLVVSINQYGNGEPKVQIGPRILLKKDGTERAPVKAGRLTIEDIMWLYDLIDDVKDEMTKLAKPETIQSIYEANNQTNQATTCPSGRNKDPNPPAITPRIMISGNAGKAKKVASGATQETMPK